MNGGALDLGIPGVDDAVEVGRGGFGVVYRARQRAFDRTVAVKVLHLPEIDDDVIRRFERELRAVGALSGHPSIVSVHAQGMTTDGHPYLIMEYCEGGSLGDRLRREGPLSWSAATETVVQIAGAVETAHNAGILHRDIKPDNLLTDAYDTPKLTDFGIARISNQASTTQTGMLTGSPAHVSPELVAGEDPSPASDVYSLASTTHTLLTGRAPFQRDDDTTLLPLLHRIMNEDPPELTSMGVPGAVADVIMAGMAKDAADRPTSARDFGAAIRDACSSMGMATADMRIIGAGRPPADPVDADRTIAGGRAPVPAPSSTAPPEAPSRPATPLAEPVGAGTTPPPPPPPAAGAVRSAGEGQAPVAPSPVPASDPGAGNRRRNGRAVAVVAGVAALVLAAVVGVMALGGGDDDPDDGPVAAGDTSTTTTTTTAPTTTTTTIGPDETLPPRPVAARLLLPLADLPAGWVFADQTLAEIDPADGWCQNPVDVAAMRQLESVAYQASPSGPFVVSAVAVFTTPAAARTYADDLLATLDCLEWFDEDGNRNTAQFLPIDTAAERADGYNHVIENLGGFLDSDNTIVVQGPIVATIVNAAFGGTDKDFSDFISIRQAEILVNR